MTRNDIEKGMKLHFDNGSVMSVSSWMGGLMTDKIVVTNNNYSTVIENVLDENLNCLIPERTLERITKYDDKFAHTIIVWEKPVELSIDQIAKKFGVKPEQIRIKK